MRYCLVFSHLLRREQMQRHQHISMTQLKPQTIYKTEHRHLADSLVHLVRTQILEGQLEQQHDEHGTGTSCYSNYSEPFFSSAT